MLRLKRSLLIILLLTYSAFGTSNAMDKQGWLMSQLDDAQLANLMGEHITNQSDRKAHARNVIKSIEDHIYQGDQTNIDADCFAKILNSGSNVLTSADNPAILFDGAIDEDPVFAQSMVVPASTQIFLIGDLHGDIEALKRIVHILRTTGRLDEDYKLRPDTIIGITGDLGDRGANGVETWCLAISLKVLNPEHIIILQGNHENATLKHGRKGLIEEIAKKYQGGEDLFAGMLEVFFNALPQVFFVGAQAQNGEIVFVQICHAGFDDQPKTINAIKSLLNTSSEKQEVDTPCVQLSHYQVLDHLDRDNGFTWSDFTSDPKIIEPLENKKRHRGCIIPGAHVLKYLASISTPGQFRVCGIIRGHTHLSYGVNKLTPSLNERPDKDQSWTTLSQPEEIGKNLGANEYPVYTITTSIAIVSSQKRPELSAFCVITFQENNDGSWLIEGHPKYTIKKAQE